MSNVRVTRCFVFGLFAAAISCGLSADAAEKEDASKSPGKRYVIIHADDAGMSHSVNRGTIDAMRDGIVSSASIMVPCPWFSEFAAHCRKHPDGDYGIHLTLNSEWDVYRWGPVAGKENVPSLCDRQGYLWDNTRQVAANAKPNEVEIELRAQIDRAKKFGVPLSHLDTHMGSVLVRPDLVEIYVNLGIEYDLPVLFIRDVPAIVKSTYSGLAGGNFDKLVKALNDRNMPLLEGIHQFYSGDKYNGRKKVYLDALRNLKPGVSQVIIHCGYDNAELQGITGSHFIRGTDRQIFSDPEVISTVKELDIEVITWKQFRKMTPEARRGK